MERKKKSDGKVPNAIKLEGGGGVKALMVLTFKKKTFFAASFMKYVGKQIQNLYSLHIQNLGRIFLTLICLKRIQKK